MNIDVGCRPVNAPKRRTWVSFVLGTLLASGCTTGPADMSPGASTPPPDANPSMEGSQLECEAKGYPCALADVDPEVRAQEARYLLEIDSILRSGSYADALEWIRGQEGVAEAEGDERSLLFRLHGGMPVPMFDAVSDAPPAETAADTEAFDIVLASAVRPADSGAEAHADVVGQDTKRDNPQNRKRALFLTPYQWQGWSMFTLGKEDPIDKLRKIPDYNHVVSDLAHIPDDRVTPHSFQGWQKYDVVFVQTHGGVNDKVMLATGVRSLLRVERDPDGVTPSGGQPDTEDVCRVLIVGFWTIPGVTCGGVRHIVSSDPKVVESWLVVIVSADFFIHEYGPEEGEPLEKTIVYIGGCHGLRVPDLATGAQPDIALALAGPTSAVVGWDDAVFTGGEATFAWALLDNLITGRRTIRAALAAACFEVGCSGDGYGATAQLAATGQGQELRLYDPPTARDPETPTTILDDGAELTFRGVAGDGRPDQLKLTVDVLGVVDPEDSDDPGATSSGMVNIVDLGPPATDYHLRFHLGDAVIGFDNLGNARHPEAEVIALDATAYRYTFLADLEFDVPVDGYETTLKVEVELPEGGISDYEVAVVLVEPEMGATVTIGDETWEFQLDAFVGGCITDTDEQITANAHVDSDLDAAGMRADFRPGAWHLELSDPDSGRNWLAAAERSHMTNYHLIPDGHSQVDELTIEDGRAWGSATFTETAAFDDALFYNTAYPLPVTGSFEVRCR